MEISLLQSLLKRITIFCDLSSYGNISSELLERYYKKAEGIFKLLKPVLEAIVDSDVSSAENLKAKFVDLQLFSDGLSDIFHSWQPLSCNTSFVLQVESLLSKLRSSSLDCLELLKLSNENLPEELNSSSLEFCAEKIRCMDQECATSVLKAAVNDQVDCVVPSSDIIVNVADLLCLKSNQDILIEAVALEKLKENTEQTERAGETSFIDKMISLVTYMHDHFVMLKQSQTSSPVLIPPDFCCPLSLELMMDPVIVSSGQTYERVFIKEWINLGLKVCPKTRQSLAHTNLIPNFTVKALIASWCETNNVKPPDPKSSININHLTWSGIRRDGSPLHPRLTTEASTSCDTALDFGRASVVASEERPSLSGDININSYTHCSVPPAWENDSLGTNGTIAQGLDKSSSAPGVLRRTSASERVTPDANVLLEISTLSSPYNGDLPSEGKAQTKASSVLNSPHGRLEFASYLGSRSRISRPSDRIIPRIVSTTPIEARAEFAEIESQVLKLIEQLQSPLVEDQRTAVAELRLLSKHNTDNRVIISNCGAIEHLVKLLKSEDARIQLDAVTALLNLSINDNNKTAIANAGAIQPLIYVLETGTPEAKENAAATLFSLSVIEELKVMIGRSGAIVPLVDLLGNGTLRGKKDAATALFNLSIFHENKARIVQAGAVRHLVHLMDPAAGMVDKAVAVLANLATIAEGRSQISMDNGIPVLVEVVELGSARGKENAAAALLQLCTTSSRCCNLVLQEGAVPPLVALSQSGTPRAKEKAQALLSYFRSQRHGNAGRA